MSILFVYLKYSKQIGLFMKDSICLRKSSEGSILQNLSSVESNNISFFEIVY